MEKKKNEILIFTKQLSSECIEVVIEATIYGADMSIFIPTIETTKRFVDSGFTKILLNCFGLKFYDAPHINLFTYIQKHLQERGGKMAVLGLNELDRKSTEMYISDDYLHFENERDSAIKFLM